MKPIERARAYVAKVPPAISGQSGHDRTFHVACVLVQGFALPVQEAWAVLSEYNAHCVPPWTNAQLRHKLDSAFKTAHSRPLGYLLHAPKVAFRSGMFTPAKNAEQGAVHSLKWLC